MVEESTAASHALSHEAVQLAELVGQLRMARTSSLRGDLERAAPHAFSKLISAPAKRSAPQLVVAARRGGTAAVAVVSNARRAGTPSGWQEF